MAHLHRLVELQHRVGTVEAVVFGSDRQGVPGAEVFDLDPALPAAGVAAAQARFTQRVGVFRQLLPGFRRLIGVQARFFKGVFVVVKHRRGAVERLRNQMAAGVAVVARHGRHELFFIEGNACVLEDLMHRHDRLRSHHGGSADFIHLQNGRRFAGAHRCDACREALFVVTFVGRHDFIVGMRLVETLRQRVDLFA